MRIYYSGSCNKMGLPEVTIPERAPHVMLAFLEFLKPDAISIARMHKQQRNVKDRKKHKNKKQKYVNYPDTRPAKTGESDGVSRSDRVTTTRTKSKRNH